MTRMFKVNGWLWDRQHLAEPVMTDTTYELLANLAFLYQAKGDVLIFGWGIRFVTNILQDKKSVQSITVVELFAEVPALTPTPPGVRVPERLIIGDFWAFVPDRTYDTIYVDIWGGEGCRPKHTNPTVNQDARLHELSAYLNPGGWMGAWAPQTHLDAPGYQEDRVAV